MIGKLIKDTLRSLIVCLDLDHIYLVNIDFAEFVNTWSQEDSRLLIVNFKMYLLFWHSMDL